MTDDSILKAVASWNWLHAYFATYRAAGVGIGGSNMSKLMLVLTVVRQVSSQPVYASMCNFTYAAIGLRLHTFMVEGTLHYQLKLGHDFTCLYVIDPTDWQAIPYIAARLPGHGIVMVQSAAPMPLLRYSLSQANPVSYTHLTLPTIYSV